jgi:hypothetical protein
MTFKYTRFLLMMIIVSVSHHVYAIPIVDTGTPTGGPTWQLGFNQYFGGRFSVADGQSINSIEGYFESRPSSSTVGVIDISIHADGGNIPGDTLFSVPLSYTPGMPLDWYGIGGLNWAIIAGTYWVSFIPDAVVGVMPGTAPNPLDEYAQGNPGGWIDAGPDHFDDLALGFRIDATPTPMPEPSIIMLLGMGLFGMIALARWNTQHKGV